MTKEDVRAILADTFSEMSDFTVREVPLPDSPVLIAYFSGFSSKEQIGRFIVAPLTEASERGQASLPLAAQITNAKAEMLADLDAAKEALLCGSALVFRDGETGFGIAVAVKNEEGRSSEEPETETVIRGPHEGFTESAETGAMLLRRRLRTEKLKRIDLKIGTLSQTEVSVMYLDGIAKQEAVDEVLRRLRAIETDIVPDSGAIEQFLQDGRVPLYPTVGNSERPDKVAAKLSEGRIAILVDGSPVVLTVPFLFCEALQVAEDYAKSPWYATFIRILRFCGLILALYLPAFFVALFVRHRELLPQNLLGMVEDARESLPFSLFWEVIVIFLIFEIVREVGLRMPKAVGSAVGLVGSLILGDSAIEAGIASAPVMIVVAFAAVCNFIVPPYMNSNVLYRFSMIVISGAFGLVGFFAAVVLSLLHMVRKTSFGSPYFSPFAPIDPAGMRDFLYMAPISEKGRAPVSVTGKIVPRGRKKEARR